MLFIKKIFAVFGNKISEKLIIQDAYIPNKIGNFQTWSPPEDANSINDLIDSSLLIETQKGLILFSNDNLATQPHAEFINSLKKDCYLALIPFSGGSGYPSTYSCISEKNKLEISKKIRNDYADISIKFLNLTSFKYYMPVAGNHIITGKSLEWHKSTSFLQIHIQLYCRQNKIISSKGVYFEPQNISENENI